MSPTILVKDGKAVFAAGGSGGPRIISSTLQVVLNYSRFGMSPDQAVTSPRIHHQWMPDNLLLENSIPTATQAALSRLGHKVTRSSGLAATQAVSLSEDGLRAKSDPRKLGTAAGY